MSARDPIHGPMLDGSLVTSLADDVFALVHAQLALLDEYLAAEDLAGTDAGDAMVTDAWLSFFRTIRCKQAHFGRDTNLFLKRDDADACIARANDYWILGEKTEDLMNTVWSHRHHNATSSSTATARTATASNTTSTDWEADQDTVDGSGAEWDTATTLVETEATKLIDRMNLDAVEAARHVAISVIETIRKLDIPRELFSTHWEDTLTRNEVATYMVRVYARRLSEIERFLVSEYLYHKVLITLARCTICFYLKSFLSKACRVRASRALGAKPYNKAVGAFRSPQRALLRIRYDLEVFSDFFRSLCQNAPAVSRLLGHEFSGFSVLFLECAHCAIDKNRCLDDFLPVVHKRTGANADVTRHFLSDLSVLMGSSSSSSSSNGTTEGGGGPHQQQQQQGRPRSVAECMKAMREPLEVIRRSVEEETNDNNNSNTTHYCYHTRDTESSTHAAHFALDRMLQEVYEERILQEKLNICGNNLCVRDTTG